MTSKKGTAFTTSAKPIILFDFPKTPVRIADVIQDKRLMKNDGSNWEGVYVLQLPITCDPTSRRDKCDKREPLNFKLGRALMGGEKDKGGGILSRLKSYHKRYGENVFVHYIRLMRKVTQNLSIDFERRLINELTSKGAPGRGDKVNREYYDNLEDVKKAVRKVEDDINNKRPDLKRKKQEPSSPVPVTTRTRASGTRGELKSIPLKPPRVRPYTPKKKKEA